MPGAESLRGAAFRRYDGRGYGYRGSGAAHTGEDAIDQQTIIGLLIALASFLLAGNIYFIKRLIDKIDTTEKIARRASVKADTLATSISNFTTELHNIRGNLKTIADLDKQLSKLEVQLDLILKKDGYYSGHGE